MKNVGTLCSCTLLTLTDLHVTLPERLHPLGMWTFHQPMGPFYQRDKCALLPRLKHIKKCQDSQYNATGAMAVSDSLMFPYSVSPFLHVLVSLLRLQEGPSCPGEVDIQP